MRKTTVIAVGKLKERFWKDACAEYAKRLSAYTELTIREIPDSNPKQEEAGILAATDKLGQAHIILLDIQGTELSSPQLSQRLDDLSLHGTSHVAFIIGGSDGVTPAVCTRSDERISFGPITLPHNLARVVLLEQIYRAHKISRGEPYHK
ncbi:MAG: 23S rRNA (pseudouridine(1915)-N(3))-methyltransferase RlmH [Eggerthellaceae bacterium]|jgi:23S rRNA (pseudouridine1915-N3)-methyltransferase